MARSATSPKPTLTKHKNADLNCIGHFAPKEAKKSSPAGASAVGTLLPAIRK
jgi:hypothetical protein